MPRRSWCVWFSSRVFIRARSLGCHLQLHLWFGALDFNSVGTFDVTTCDTDPASPHLSIYWAFVRGEKCIFLWNLLGLCSFEVGFEYLSRSKHLGSPMQATLETHKGSGGTSSASDSSAKSRQLRLATTNHKCTASIAQKIDLNGLTFIWTASYPMLVAFLFEALDIRRFHCAVRFSLLQCAHCKTEGSE